MNQVRVDSIKRLKGNTTARVTEALTCPKGYGGQGAERRGSELRLPDLPDDILYHIHALMPIKDAARAAGVSIGFRRSWELYPKLILNKETLGINESRRKRDKVTSDFISIVDRIMQNHSGIGVKAFMLGTYPCYNVDPSYVDRWLHGALTPGIEEFGLWMPRNNKTEYNFPCSLLSTGRGSSMRSFFLAYSAFHSAAKVGCLSNLTSLDLYSVHITEDELCGFLSRSLALKQLRLSSCNDIVCLKIPCLLSNLNLLHVDYCVKLDKIESRAPNLSRIEYVGHTINISLGDPTQLQDLQMLSLSESNMLYHMPVPSFHPLLRMCKLLFYHPLMRKLTHQRWLESSTISSTCK